jgi:hypothetical protein
MSFHSSVDSGVTVNRFSQDLELIDMELPAAALGVAIGKPGSLTAPIIMTTDSVQPYHSEQRSFSSSVSRQSI